MLFWIICLSLTLAVAAPLVWVVLRRKADARSAADFDIAVYRDQLRDIDRDLERGVIAPDMAERTRVEISRRILDADRARQAAMSGVAPRGAAIVGATVLGAVLLGGTFLTYRALGAPGYGDLPLKHRLAMAEEFHESRPDQATAEAQMPPQPTPELDPAYLELIEKLRATVDERPGEARGLQLLAQNEANIGNYTAAHEAQQALLELTGDSAPAQAWSELAEFYVLAAGGYVSPEAEAALEQALQRDPRDGPARYYTGLMFAQTGRPDLAFRTWDPLLRQSAPDAPWAQAIRSQIGDMAAMAGIRYTPLPAPTAPALAGPSTDDVAAAQDMAPEDRQAMIEGMVEGLAERLAVEGGPAEEWARLIGALGVLGQTDRAAVIYGEARGVFAADPAGLAAVDAAATRIGLDQ